MKMINYIRVQRLATDSYVTIHLPYPMKDLDEVEQYLSHELPGWECVMGCYSNPDSE